jgi:hypothetical protein
MAAATWQREEASEVERAEEAAEAECWTEETEDGRRRTEEVPRHSGIAGATEQQLEEWQGLTLVHFSAQLERFLWDRGCAYGLC